MQQANGHRGTTTTMTTLGMSDPPPLSDDLADIVAYMHHIGDRRRTAPAGR